MADVQEAARLDDLLAQFDSRLGVPLKRFLENLRIVDADAVMFMARKSFCLYDAFVEAGLPPIDNAVVLSDRVLDVDLAWVRGKKVLLVDDALILGTSVGKARRRLEEAGATVSVHVFCRDRNSARNSLIEPDHVTIDADAGTTHYFATAALQALAVAGRPYIVDFPVTPPLPLLPDEAAHLSGPPGWEAVDITSQVQREHDVASYVFLPGDDVLDSFKASIGGVSTVLDLVKVRGYVRRASSAKATLTLVPIVTLRPAAGEALRDVFHALLRALPSGDDHLELVRQASRGDHMAHRLLQYALGIVLGSAFLDSFDRPLTGAVTATFPDRESPAHFGSWNESSAAYVRALASDGKLVTLLKAIEPAVAEALQPAAIPDRVQSLADEMLPGIPEIFEPDPDGTTVSAVMPTMVAGLAEVFYRMCEAKEPLAHAEAERLGSRFLDATTEEAPHRDRLEIGLPWRTLTRHFLGRAGFDAVERARAVFSLALDHCSDRGLAVPVTVVEGGVVLRGYRFGEPAVFREPEFLLAYRLGEAFLEGAGRADIPRLAMAKLLALLLQVGLANQFLRPDYAGGMGSARVAMERKGAVPVIKVGTASDRRQEIWLSDHLQKHQVFRKNPRTGTFVLGDAPPGGQRAGATADAADRSAVLGQIVGMLFNTSKPKSAEDPPLGDAELIALTTVSRAQDAAAALQVELRIFRDWYDRARSAIASTRGEEGDAVSKALVDCRRSEGKEAPGQIRMKYVLFSKGKVPEIIDRCEQYLQRSNPIAAKTWAGYWRSYLMIDAAAERKAMRPVLTEAATLGWEMGAGVILVEAALTQKKRAGNPRRRTPAWRKFAKKLDDLGALEELGLTKPRCVREAEETLEARIDSESFDVADADAVLDKGLTILDRCVEPLNQVLEATDTALATYSGLGEQQRYDWVLWYDIYDSTATRAAAEGHNVVTQRKEVAAFKQHLSRTLASLRDEIESRGGGFHAQSGDIESTDDEKHIFFGGAGSVEHLEQCVAALQRALRMFKRVRIRAIVAPCTLAGSSAFSRRAGRDVEDPRFWEHFSRVRKEARALVDELELLPGASCLAVTAPTTAAEPQVSLDGWTIRRQSTIETEIEGLTRRHKLWLGTMSDRAEGSLRPPRSQDGNASADGG